jgi:hypothetical protein
MDFLALPSPEPLEAAFGMLVLHKGVIAGADVAGATL